MTANLTTANLNNDWYSLLIRPMAENYHVCLTSAALCFLCQFASGPIFRYILIGPEKWNNFKKPQRRDAMVRFVACIHTFVILPEVYYLFFSEPGLFNEDNLVSKYYDYSESSQFWLAVGVGYFIWDLFVSFYYDFGVAFKGHAILTFLVVYFTLHPFLHYLGRFFHGVFELSSPFVHIRHIMIETNSTDNIFYFPIQVGLVIVFTVCRVILGTYFSFYVWFPDMLALIQSGQAHSVAIISYMLFANICLMSLQYYWWSMMIKGVIDLLKGGDAKAHKE